MARLFLLALATPPAAAAPQSQRQLSLSLSDLVLPPWSLMKVAYCKFLTPSSHEKGVSADALLAIDA